MNSCPKWAVRRRLSRVTIRSSSSPFHEHPALKLEPAKTPVEMLIIDSIERPAEN